MLNKSSLEALKSQTEINRNNYKLLENINKINFTYREIDVISCIVSGRATKVIASFLDISPKTVESYIYNIMGKLGCNSRESIIDFAEKSDKYHLIKNHYIFLKVQKSYEITLQKISNIVSKKNLHCLIVYNEIFQSLANDLDNDLKKSGFQTIVYIEKENYTKVDLPININCVKISSSVLLGCDLNNLIIYNDIKSKINKTIYISLNEECCIKKKYNYYTTLADFKIDYHISVFNLIKEITDDVSIEDIFSDFKSGRNFFQKDLFCKGDSLNKIIPHQNFHIKRSIGKIAKTKVNTTKFFLIVSVLCLALYGNGIVYKMNIPSDESAQCKLWLPPAHVLIKRQSLILEIIEKFKGQRNVETLALIGIGGAGKTILARQYAMTERPSFIWEINAESKESVITSFNNLARALAETKKDKKTLKGLQLIISPKEREKQITHFVKNQLKLKPGWLLIYDNVENFWTIEGFYPRDPKPWGKGKVIITTRNSNIQNAASINHTIKVGEMSQSEQLELFLKILHSGHAHKANTLEKTEALSFLQKIPPFPLDISISSYYIKETGASYNQYLSYISVYDERFLNIQKKIMCDTGGCNKIRYDIIILSLDKIIKENKDFEELFVSICLLAPDNIPRILLDKIKNSLTTDNFIYSLKKHYFINSNAALTFRPFSTISMHHAIQEIILQYLKKVVSSEKGNKYIKNVVDALVETSIQAVEEEDVYLLENLTSQFESILRHKALFGEDLRDKLMVELGIIYFYKRDYKKAKENLEYRMWEREKEQIQKSLVYLGNIYRELGDYKKSIDLLKRGVEYYKSNYHKNPTKVAWSLAYLGNFYRSFGNYQKARKFLEKSLFIYQKKNPNDTLKIAWVMTLLQYVYTDLGDYEKAKYCLEKSLSIYKNISPNNNIKIGWVLALLGNIYQEQGEYDKAKEFLEQSLVVYKKTITEEHLEIAWVFGYLGNVYIKLRDYKKAKNLLSQALRIYEKKFCKNHTKIAWITALLGNLYQAQGDYRQAKVLLEKSLNIYQEKFPANHIANAWVLMCLGNVYTNLGSYEKSKSLLEQSLSIYLDNLSPKHPKVILVEYHLDGVCERLNTSKKGALFGRVQGSH